LFDLAGSLLFNELALRRVLELLLVGELTHFLSPSSWRICDPIAWRSLAPVLKVAQLNSSHLSSTSNSPPARATEAALGDIPATEAKPIPLPAKGHRSPVGAALPFRPSFVRLGAKRRERPMTNPTEHEIDLERERAFRRGYSQAVGDMIAGIFMPESYRFELEAWHRLLVMPWALEATPLPGDPAPTLPASF
jgi:hypothetical protein